MSNEALVELLYDEDESNTINRYVEWVIGTTTSYHATPNKEFFTFYKVGDFGRVKMGNHSSADIVRVGDVCAQIDVNCTMNLRDA